MFNPAVRIAVLSDIHGNLPALEAVLADVEDLRPDLLVLGGDVAAGPMPAQVLDRLSDLPYDTRWVMGNADRLVVAAFDDGADPATIEDPIARGDAWVARQITRAHRDLLASFAPLVRADDVLFCHGSPRSDTESITKLTPPARLEEILTGVRERLVVCGHTHHQFDLGPVVNAGSVGMPYEGTAGAFWLQLDDGRPTFRRTDYDVEAALRVLRATGFPDVEEMMLRESLVTPADPDEVARLFEPA